MSDVLVLCYHAVSDTWPAALSTTRTRLEEQLELLLEHGYRGATFTDAVISPPAGRRVVAITFDDGYRSVIELGLPILRRLGLPATVFVPTAFVGIDRPMAWKRIDRWLGGPHEAELLPLSWDDLSALTAEGWEIGSHTRSHPRLTSLDDVSLAAELTESRRECEARLGLPCLSLAYPYGDVDARVVRAAREAGFEAAAALPERMHAARRLQWPRVGVWHADTLPRFRAKTSPSRRRLAALPAGHAMLYVDRKLRKSFKWARADSRRDRRIAPPGDRA